MGRRQAATQGIAEEVASDYFFSSTDLIGGSSRRSCAATEDILRFANAAAGVKRLAATILSVREGHGSGLPTPNAQTLKGSSRVRAVVA